MFHDFLADAGALLSGLVEPGKEASLDPQTGNIVVPDAELLFSGKYQQAGRDLLILGDDGDKVVIPDYFASKKRPNLQSPDGALLAADIVDILAGANRAQYAQTEGESGRAAIGRVELVTGMATAPAMAPRSSFRSATASSSRTSSRPAPTRPAASASSTAPPSACRPIAAWS